MNVMIKATLTQSYEPKMEIETGDISDDKTLGLAEADN